MPSPAFQPMKITASIFDMRHIAHRLGNQRVIAAIASMPSRPGALRASSRSQEPPLPAALADGVTTAAADSPLCSDTTGYSHYSTTRCLCIRCLGNGCWERDCAEASVTASSNAVPATNTIIFIVALHSLALTAPIPTQLPGAPPRSPDFSA